MAIARLPNDLLRKILRYLDTGDQLRLTKCCSTFASVMPFQEIDMDVALITPLREDDTYDLPDEYELAEAQLRRDILSKASTYFSLASCRIVKLNPWSWVWWEDGSLMLSQAFPNLRHLIVGGSVRLDCLHCFVNLRTLIVQGLIMEGDCDEGDVAVLCGLHLFRVPDLSLADLWSAVGGAIVPGMRQLRTSRSKKFLNDDVVLISKVLPNLEEVTLCNLQGKIWIEWFAMCSRLEILKMVHSRVTLITNFTVLPLGLRTLCLANWCKVDDFSFLQQLHCLAELVIWCDDFTCSDLEQLPSSVSLTYLDVSYTGAISDELLDVLLARRYSLKFLIANVHPQRFRDWFHYSGSIYSVHYGGWPSVKSVTGFSTSALTPGLEVLSVNDHNSINDSLFVKDSASFKTLHSLRLLGTACTEFGITQLYHHRKTAIERGDILPTLALAANCDPCGFPERLQDCFIVFNDSMWVSNTELEMMSFLAARWSYRELLKEDGQWSISSVSGDEGDDSWSSDGTHHTFDDYDAELSVSL